MSDTGWEPLRVPPHRAGAQAFITTPFTRLARTHALAVAGDTLITIALAGSLFFSIDPDAARGRVALYLALTMAPFSIVAPLIGPALDRARGGRRWVVIGSNGLRALVCLLMIGELDNMLLFPLAFAALVLAKSYHVAKSAIVPTVVRSDDELVEANSRLSLLSGIVTFAAAIPGGLLIALTDSRGALVLGIGVFTFGALLALRIPPTQVATDETSETERHELRSGGIVLAASAMGLMRGIVGFLAFLLAFHLRAEGAPPWQFGVVLGTSGVGSLLGSLVAPALRRSGMAEERMLQLVLLVTSGAAILAAIAGGLAAASGLALALAISAACGKLAFDSVVQRDAPDANRGRSFARFETRFQLTWVIGAFIPVVIPIPLTIGFLIVSGCAAFALFSYVAGVRALARGQLPVRRPNPITRRLPTLQRAGAGFSARLSRVGGFGHASGHGRVDGDSGRGRRGADAADAGSPGPSAPSAHGASPAPGTSGPEPSVPGSAPTPDDEVRARDRTVVVDPTNLQ
jgi:hypothetical protein